MFAKILVPVDGSPQAEKAAEKAIDLAKVTKAKIIVIHIVDMRKFADNSLASIAKNIRELLEGEGKTVVKKIANLTKAKSADVETRVAIGIPSEEIVKAAADEKVDLIIIGSSGKTKLERALLGSVTDRVAHYAGCSVMIVR